MTLSRVFNFWNHKVILPNNLEVELNNIVNNWNQHDQGLIQWNQVHAKQLRLALAIKTSSGSYNVTDTETVVIVNKAVGAATTVNLPDSPSTGRVLIVKDGKGDAGANNITIDGQSKDIDGVGTATISSNYGATRLIYNGTQWNVL